MNTETDNKKPIVRSTFNHEYVVNDANNIEFNDVNLNPTEGRSLPPLGLYEVVLQWTGNFFPLETERKEKHYVFAESKLDAVALIPEDTFEKAKTFKINRLCCLNQIIQKPIER